MNFKIAAAISLFCALQLSSCTSLDRDRDVFFKKLYGCPLYLLPHLSTWTQAASSLCLDEGLSLSTGNGQCCRFMLYPVVCFYEGLWTRQTVNKDCVHTMDRSWVEASDREQK